MFELHPLTLGIIISQIYCLSDEFSKSTTVFWIDIYYCAVNAEKDSHIRRYVRHPLVFGCVAEPKAEADDIEWKENQACHMWPAIEWFNLSSSAMSASCSLASLSYILKMSSPHITASSLLFLHLYLTVKNNRMCINFGREIKQGREDVFNNLDFWDFSLRWLIAFIKWHQQQYD